MSTENQPADDRKPHDAGQQPDAPDDKASDAVDGLKGKKPEELTPDELRLMADTMPGDGPGD